MEFHDANNFKKMCCRVSYNSHKEFCSHNATEDMELDSSSSCKKFNLRGKDAHSERNNTIKRIQKKCVMRMKKLIQKHQRETEEFHRVWNEKKLELEKDNRLEAHMIQFIYGETAASIERLKILGGSFRKKLEEDVSLKETQLKDLLKKQLAARNLERRKAVNWLSCCHAEQTVGCGEFSQDLLTDENFGCMNLPASERVCDELKSVVLNKVVPIETSEILGHVEPKSLSNHSNEGDTILCPDALMNQRVETDEGLHLTEEIPIQEVSLDQCGSLQMPVQEGEIPTSLVRDDPEERDAPVIGSSGLRNSVANSELAVEANTGVLLAEETLEPLQEASSVPEVQIYASLVMDNPEERDASVLESCTLLIRDTNSELADAVVPVQSHVEAQTSKNCEQSCLLSMDASPSSNLHPATDVEGQSNDSGPNLFQTAESSETTLVLADESSEGPEDHIHESLASSDLQNTGAYVQEGQGTLQIEVEALEPVELVQFHSELPIMENSEQLHPMPNEVSPSNNRSPATEVEHQNPELVRNFSPTSQVVEDTLQLDESSQIERGLELQSRCMDIGSLNRVAQDSGAHMSTSSLNMAVAQSAVDTEECANQSDLQLGIDADNVHESSSSTLFLEPNHIVNLPFWFANPLENELNEICKKGEHLKRSFEDVTSRLRSDREKEMQETVAQIRRKYEMKLKANEDDFQLKISNLRKNQNKVFLNKLLASTLRPTQIDMPPVVLQGMPSGSSQQLRQSLSLQFPLQSSAGQPPLPQFIGPTAHTWQHFGFLHPTGHVTSQNISTPVQRFQHTAVQSSGNLPLVGQIHPPYQPVFKPAAPSSMYPARVHTFSQLMIHSKPSYPPAAVPRPPPPTLPPQPCLSQPPMPPTQSWQVQSHNRLGAVHDPFLVAPSNHNCATPLPDISLSFDLLESSYLEALVNVHSVNPNNAAASSSGVVSLTR